MGCISKTISTTVADRVSTGAPGSVAQREPAPTRSRAVGRGRATRRRLLALPLLVAALGLAAPASASPYTLRRAVGNILFAPLDIVLSPVVATRTAYQNLQWVDDTPAVRVVWLIPGVIWSTGIQAGAGLVREFIGLVEFLPGLGLFFFEADLDPLFDPAERSEALVDFETDPLWIKFGVTYVQ